MKGKGEVRVDTKTEFEELIRRTRSGSKHAYGELYENTVKDVYQTVHFLLDDKSDVDDVVQEIYIEVLRNLHRFNTDKPFRPWLKGIAIKQISAYRRRRWISFRNYQKISKQPSEVEDDFSPQVVDDLVNKQLVQLVEQLPFKLRQVIILRYLNEHSQEEVASILKIPVGTVKSRVHTALKKLRKQEELGNIFLRKVENV